MTIDTSTSVSVADQFAASRGRNYLRLVAFGVVCASIVIAMPGGIVATTDATEPEPTTAIQELEGDELEDDPILGPEEFEAVLDVTYEPPVHEYEEVDETGYLVVTSHSFGDTNVLAEEMGTVAGVYAAYVDEEAVDEPPEQLVVEVREIDGETVAGTYSIDIEWMEAYNDGELSGEEVALLIMETIEVEA